MNYPTLAEVEVASHEQLARWYRFLPFPGDNDKVAILNRVFDRFKELGFFTPALSKRVGWKEVK